MTQEDVWYVPVTPGGTPVIYGFGTLLGELVIAQHGATIIPLPGNAGKAA